MVNEIEVLKFDALMQGSRPPEEYKGNGIGTTGNHWLCRLGLWFIDSDTYAILERTAARFHDWHYHRGGSSFDRSTADYFLVENCRTVLSRRWSRKKQFLLMRWTLWKIKRAVRSLGWSAFSYS